MSASLLALLLLAQAAPPMPQLDQDQAAEDLVAQQDQEEVIPSLQEQAEALTKTQQRVQELEQQVQQQSEELDTLNQTLAQETQTREQLQNNVVALEDRGAVLEEARTARIAAYENMTGLLNGTLAVLERGNSNPADQIPAVRSAIQTLLADAQSRSGELEVRTLVATLDTLDGAETALRSGDLHWGRIALVTAMDYALQAAAAAGANPNRVWTE